MLCCGWFVLRKNVPVTNIMYKLGPIACPVIVTTYANFVILHSKQDTHLNVYICHQFFSGGLHYLEQHLNLRYNALSYFNYRQILEYYVTRFKKLRI